ncbi:riboflavin biosynthesis pyrimidine reductase [Pseudarthrobacter defluvii]|uniref:pyrimidine reductase family protein n=1 Tax=Pseudarthrobacter defluvii TaxID=410837 RepID=UPI002786A713|nr:pyrimidine reductase family protein [Pseudarthrobacter defluvii]MDQ0769497.1 riboflavin biosynthesis pyrimidine reductase [Pseudarthrobacter defluvii]
MIDRLLPSPVTAATDTQLLNWYTHPVTADPHVSFNFVSSLDGAATLNGRSGGLGNAADRRIMVLLRRTADILLLGAGTVRTEGYSGDLIGADGVQWRQDNGKNDRPSLAVVSGSLRIDPDLPFFTSTPQRPMVITTAEASRVRRRSLEKVADVITCGQRRLDVDLLVRELKRRGHSRIHSEGGPHLFGTFQQAGRVDELCLSVSPVLAGGSGTRIAVSSQENSDPRRMHLQHVLRCGDMLFLRYLAHHGSGTTNSAHAKESAQDKGDELHGAQAPE